MSGQGEAAASGPPVRPVDDAELAAVLSLNNAAVPAVNELARADLVWFSAHSRSFVTTASPDAPIEDFLILLDGPMCPYPSENFGWFRDHVDGPFLYVDRVVVAVERQRRGRARTLYEWAVQLEPRRWPVLCAEVNLVPRNARSLQFHASLGFVEIGRHWHRDGKLLSMLMRPL